MLIVPDSLSLEDIDWSEPVNWDCALNTGLVSWWLAAPGYNGWGSAKWRDMVQRSQNHGTLTSMDPPTDWVSAKGRPGGWGALDFAGDADPNSDYVDTGFDSGRFSGNAGAVSLWARSDTTKVHSPFGNNDADVSGLDREAFTIFDNNGQFWGRVRTGGTDKTVSGGTWSSLTWYHVMLVYDGAAVTLYANGKQVATAAATGAIYDSQINYRIGVRGDWGAFSQWAYDGLIDDVRIYDRGPSALEVAALHEQSKQGHPDTLRRVRRVAYSVPAAAASPLLLRLQTEGLFTGGVM